MTPDGATWTKVYEYGDDDLLDQIVGDGFPYPISVEHVVEDGGVRSETRRDSDLSRETTIFDHVGRLAFQVTTEYDEVARVFVDDIDYMHERLDGNEWWYQRTRHALDVPRQTFPYRPFDLTESDIDEFSYDYKDRFTFARRPSFSKDGQLEHMTLTAGFPPCPALSAMTRASGRRHTRGGTLIG